jgi:hypothetical protein
MSTTEAERAKGQAILEALITTLREGQAREFVAPTHTTVKAHVQTVVIDTCKRLSGKATRADVLETWLMMHLTAALKERGEVGEPVLPAAGDA